MSAPSITPRWQEVAEGFIQFIDSQLRAKAAEDKEDTVARLKLSCFDSYLKAAIEGRFEQIDSDSSCVELMISVCMVVAANHRTSFEVLLGPREYVLANILGVSHNELLCFTSLNGWLKQEGAKVLLKFIRQATTPPETEGWLKAGLWGFLDWHVSSLKRSAPTPGSAGGIALTNLLPGFGNVAIHECSAAPVASGGNDDNEGEGVAEGWLSLSSYLRQGSRSLEPFSEFLRIPSEELFHIGTAAKYSRWMRLLQGTTRASAEEAKSTPPPTAAYPKVQRGISSAIADDESRLLLSFIFEGRRRSAAAKIMEVLVNEPHHEGNLTLESPLPDLDHFSLLLARIPQRYPTIPTQWSPFDYVMLTGTDLAEVVPQKKLQLSEFVSSVRGALFAALRIPEVVTEGEGYASLATSPLGELHVEVIRYLVPEWSKMDLVQQKPTAILAMLLTEIFSEANAQWARSTFDSRAFNLNFGGEVRLVLAPIIDMVNHDGDRSDILVRRIDPETGDFVIENGAGISEPQGDANEETVAPKEIFMSYGPLQNWELLLSYGFAFPSHVSHPSDQAVESRAMAEVDLRAKLYLGNVYDRVPLPLDLTGDDDAQDEESQLYVAKRKDIIEKACLRVGQGVWIGPPVQLHSSVLQRIDASKCSVLSSLPPVPPYPAVLASLRLTHAQAEEFPSLDANPFAAVSIETETTMIQTLSAVLKSIILQFYNPSLEETVELLYGGGGPVNSNQAVQRESGESNEEEVVSLSTNERLSYFVNLPLLAMAHACLKWCCLQTGDDFEQTVKETLALLEDNEPSDNDNEECDLVE